MSLGIDLQTERGGEGVKKYGNCADVIYGWPLTDAWKAALLDTRKPDCIGIIWPEMTFDADWAIEHNVGTMPVYARPQGDSWLRCRNGRMSLKLNHYWFQNSALTHKKCVPY